MSKCVGRVMRECVLTEKSRLLLRSAALFALVGFGAGCSADMSRFTSRDFTTGSVNQKQIIGKVPKVQPFPSDDVSNQTANTDVADDNFEPVRSAASSVTRRDLAPIAAAGAAVKTKSTVAPLSAARRTVTPVELTANEFEPALEPVKAAPKNVKKKVVAAAKSLDDQTTGTVQPKVRKIELVKKSGEPLSVSEEFDAQPKLKRVAPASADKGGWSSEGGTLVTVREGETIFNFSKRYGVPVVALLKANDLTDASQVTAGQQLVVPAYRYSQNSEISAPDANADTAAAKSTSGTVYDVPVDKVPLPRNAPSRDNVAVLPSVPQLKQKTAPADELAMAAPKTTPKSDRLKADAKAPVIAKAVMPADATKNVELAAASEANSGGEPKQVAAPGNYAVASGDSLYKIARAHGVSVAALKEANGISDGKLKIGQPLKIPAVGDVAVASAKKANVDPIQTGAAGQSGKLAKPATEQVRVKEYTPPKSDAVKAEADQDESAAPNATGISKLRWPVRGRTVSGYGQRDSGGVNDGVNISVPEGTPIKAAENGVVIYAGNGLKEFGNTVLVRHADGLVTVYGYASEISVKRGQTIKRGQELAKTGMTGSAKAPMLHFEVRKNSSPVDPSGYLE